MTAKLHLAKPEDLERLLPMVQAFHEGLGVARTDDLRRRAVEPLLEGVPFGAIYLIGPRRAPVGYLSVSFGWALELGGLDCFLDEFYVRPAVRGRGMGTEALHALLVTMGQAGVMAMHLEVARDAPSAGKMYSRFGFQMRDNFCLMSKDLQD